MQFCRSIAASTVVLAVSSRQVCRSGEIGRFWQQPQHPPLGSPTSLGYGARRGGRPAPRAPRPPLRARCGLRHGVGVHAHRRRAARVRRRQRDDRAHRRRRRRDVRRAARAHRGGGPRAGQQEGRAARAGRLPAHRGAQQGQGVRPEKLPGRGGKYRVGLHRSGSPYLRLHRPGLRHDQREAADHRRDHHLGALRRLAQGPRRAVRQLALLRRGAVQDRHGALRLCALRHRDHGCAGGRARVLLGGIGGGSGARDADVCQRDAGHWRQVRRGLDVLGPHGPEPHLGHLGRQARAGRRGRRRRQLLHHPPHEPLGPRQLPRLTPHPRDRQGNRCLAPRAGRGVRLRQGLRVHGLDPQRGPRALRRPPDLARHGPPRPLAALRSLLGRSPGPPLVPLLCQARRPRHPRKDLLHPPGPLRGHRVRPLPAPLRRPLPRPRAVRRRGARRRGRVGAPHLHLPLHLLLRRRLARAASRPRRRRRVVRPRRAARHRVRPLLGRRAGQGLAQGVGRGEADRVLDKVGMVGVRVREPVADAAVGPDDGGGHRPAAAEARGRGRRGVREGRGRGTGALHRGRVLPRRDRRALQVRRQGGGQGAGRVVGSGVEARGKVRQRVRDHGRGRGAAGVPRVLSGVPRGDGLQGLPGQDILPARRGAGVGGAPARGRAAQAGQAGSAGAARAGREVVARRAQLRVRGAGCGHAAGRGAGDRAAGQEAAGGPGGVDQDLSIVGRSRALLGYWTMDYWTSCIVRRMI